MSSWGVSSLRAAFRVAQALASAEAGRKTQSRDAGEDEIARLQSRVGEVTMDKELLEEKVRKLEGKTPLGSGRSRS